MRQISVIIPVYNTSEYLHRCVDSVLAQADDLCDVILVDDGSTDASPDICEAYANAHPHLVKVIHQKNQGPAAARNAGLAIAAGRYLSFIDSDDYLEPDMYRRMLSLIDEYGADMAVASMWVEQMDGSRYCRIQESVRCCWNTHEALIELNSYRYFHSAFWNTLISREAFGKHRFPPMRQCEDYALLYQVVASCKKVAYTSDPVYHYIQRPNSVSRTVNISRLPMEISKAQLAFFQERFPDIAYVAETDCAFAHMGIYTSHVRSGVSCPADLLKTLQKESRRYLGSVLRNPHIPRIKKLQALTFCIAPPVYKFIIKRTSHR